jgi:hypothetical protein
MNQIEPKSLDQIFESRRKIVPKYPIYVFDLRSGYAEKIIWKRGAIYISENHYISSIHKDFIEITLKVYEGCTGDSGVNFGELFERKIKRQIIKQAFTPEEIKIKLLLKLIESKYDLFDDALCQIKSCPICSK